MFLRYLVFQEAILPVVVPAKAGIQSPMSFLLKLELESLAAGKPKFLIQYSLFLSLGLDPSLRWDDGLVVKSSLAKSS